MSSNPPGGGPLAAVPVTGVPAHLNPNDIATRAGLLDVMLSAAAATTAKHVATVRKLQSEAAESVRRTTEGLKGATQNLLDIKRMLRQAKIDQVEDERRLRRAENDLEMDERTRDIYNDALVMAANQSRADAAAAARIQTLVNEQKEQEERIGILRLTIQERHLEKELQMLNARPIAPAAPAGPDPLEAEAKLIVADAAADLVVTDADHLYHAYAGCHYVAALLRGVEHNAAMADAFEVVLNLMRRTNPIQLPEATAFQRRYETFKGLLRSRTATDRSAAADRAKAEAQLQIEQLRKDVEESRLRTAQQMASAFGDNDYETTQ